MEHYDVLGIGNAITDLLKKTDSDFIKNYNFVNSEMRLIEEDQAKCLYAPFKDSMVFSGGSVANTISGISSLGGSAAFIGKVKDDAMGKAFAGDLTKAGVTYKTQMASEGESTAVSFIAVNEKAERSMLTYLGATKNISKEDIDEDLIKNSEILYLEGYLWDRLNGSEAMMKAIECAKKYNRKIAFSLSDLFCVNKYSEDFLSLLDNHVDILFSNDQEAKAMCSVDSVEEAIDIFSKKCTCAVITRGDKGSVAGFDGVFHFYDAASDVDVIDTTGAGDAYAAGFLYGYTQGKSLDHCVYLANMLSKEVIGHIGGRL